MKGLLLKDIYTFGNFKKSLLIQLVIVTAFSIFMKGAVGYVVSILMLYTSTLLVSTFSYDESAKWDRYAIGLPVARATIVGAKYLTALLILLVMGTAAFILSVGIGLAMGNTAILTETLAALGLILSLSLISLTVSLPVAFKLGAEKARIASMASYLVFFGVIMLAVFLLRGRLDDMTDTVLYILVGCILAFSVALFAASYPLSRRLYAGREF